MKTLKLTLLSLLFISLSAAAGEPDCESTAIQVPAEGLLKTLKAASEGLYKDVASLKVNHDGEGKLSIFYENGVPKLLKMTYTNGKGATSIGQKSFEELAAGKPLNYENKDKPGNAIILEKGPTFINGSKYSLVLKIRSKLDPVQYTSYPIEFESDMAAPKLSAKGKNFKNIIISPGVSWLSWDGTFTKVDFK